MSFLESARRDLSVGEVSKRSAPSTIWEDVLGDALSENGQKVVKIAENGAKLSDFIQKTFKNEPFYFFTGNLRGEDIPEIENKSENSIFELKTYKTTLNLMKFDQIFDKIMFFSPSGVISFSAENNFADAVAVCIGTTTASEAKKHTDKIEVANTTTVESVIAKP